MAVSSMITSYLLPPSPHHHTRRSIPSQFAYFPNLLSSRFKLSQAPLLLIRGRGRRRRRSQASRTLRVGVVAALQSNLFKVIQTIWRVAKDGIEAGTNLVPDSIPKPIARIGVASVAAVVALFLLKSFLSTAFFVLAMMGLIYFTFIALNTDEGPRGGGGTTSGGTTSTEEETLEEARKIMEKYK